MARRTKATTEESPVEVPTTQEDTVSTETVESTEVDFPEQAEVTSSDAETETAEVEAEPDYTEILAAIETAVSESDSSTGDLSEANVDKIRQAFRALPAGKARNGIKKQVEQSMSVAMSDMDIRTARAYLNVKENGLVAARPAGAPTEKKASEPRPPANPTESFVSTAARLRAAMDLLLDSAPENLDPNWRDQVAEKVSELKAENENLKTIEVPEGEEGPKASAALEAVLRLAKFKTPRQPTTSNRKPFEGTRRSVAEHIAEVFADKAEGEFVSIADIVSTKTSVYGDDKPSQGAVLARIFPQGRDCTLVGVQPAEVDGKKGLIKATPAE